MRYVRWLVLFLMFATGPLVAQEKPDFEPINPSGAPKGLKVGLPARYTIWHDKEGWHLRVTTDGQAIPFTGKIEPVDGKIVAIRLVSSTEKASPLLKTETASFNVSIKVGGKAVMNGLDLVLADTATAVKFTLQVDGKDAPDRIFVGPEGKHPKGATFYLPARPGK